MRMFYTIVIIALFSLPLKAQICSSQNLTFFNQNSIDNFLNQYPACYTIDADVTISGSNINDLNIY